MLILLEYFKMCFCFREEKPAWTKNTKGLADEIELKDTFVNLKTKAITELWPSLELKLFGQ